jgi:hypothetical protein
MARKRFLWRRTRRIRRAVEVPEIFNLEGVEPGFDMREQAVVDLQFGPQIAHEIQDGSAVTLAHGFTGIEAQANIVVAPDAHRLDLLEQAHRLLDPRAGLEHVAQDDEAFRPVLLEHGDRLLQLPGVLMDVGE